MQKTNSDNLSMTYKVGETVVIKDSKHNLEWVVTITAFIAYGPVQNRFHLFLDGEYFAAKTVHGNVAVDSWTGKPKMVIKKFYISVLNQQH